MMAAQIKDSLHYLNEVINEVHMEVVHTTRQERNVCIPYEHACVISSFIKQQLHRLALD